MECLTLLSNAILSLLLFIYDQLDAVYKILKDIPPELVKEVGGKKTVKFTMPLPKFTMTAQPFQRLIEVKIMLMSVRVQYEQQTNAAFPLE